jgi:glycosyltransferase involved in cell wall biosynthesis
VFVFPTRYEAASLAILEAAAAGLAIVTTSIAMAAEVFVEGESALLVPNTDDAEPTTRALRQIVDDHALLQELREGAHRVALRHTWDEVWKKYKPLYEEILNQRHSQRPRP